MEGVGVEGAYLEVECSFLFKSLNEILDCFGTS